MNRICWPMLYVSKLKPFKQWNFKNTSGFLGKVFLQKATVFQLLGLTVSVQLFLTTNRQRWDSNPRTQTVLDDQSNSLTTRPPCLTRVHSFVNWIEPINFWSKGAPLQIEYVFLLKTKNLSNQTIVRSKIDLTSVYLKSNDEFSTLVVEQD